MSDCGDLGGLFESWNARFLPLPYVVKDPPQPVSVNFGAAFPRHPARIGPGGLPMRVRTEGLNADAPVEGLLHAWMRLTTGEWLCLLTFRLPTGNGHGFVEMRQWCPAQAAVPRTVSRLAPPATDR